MSTASWHDVFSVKKTGRALFANDQKYRHVLHVHVTKHTDEYHTRAQVHTRQYTQNTPNLQGSSHPTYLCRHLKSRHRSPISRVKSSETRKLSKSGACFKVGARRTKYLCKSMGAASLRKSMGAASLHKSTGAASLHKSMGAASLYTSMGPTSLHKSTGAASLNKSMGVASLNKSMGVVSQYKSTRSSAQGNCSAKSLVPMSLILPCSSTPCHILHYHMLLRPKGTSHNEHCTLLVH